MQEYSVFYAAILQVKCKNGAYSFQTCPLPIFTYIPKMEWFDEEEVLVLGCRDSHVRRVRHEDREVRRIDILAVLVDQLIGEASCVTRLILDEKCFVEIDKVLLATEVESLQST